MKLRLPRPRFLRRAVGCFATLWIAKVLLVPQLLPSDRSSGGLSSSSSSRMRLPLAAAPSAVAGHQPSSTPDSSGVPAVEHQASVESVPLSSPPPPPPPPQPPLIAISGAATLLPPSAKRNTPHNLKNEARDSATISKQSLAGAATTTRSSRVATHKAHVAGVPRGVDTHTWVGDKVRSAALHTTNLNKHKHTGGNKDGLLSRTSHPIRNAVPAAVNNETICFTNISTDRVSVRWQAAERGNYQWQILGYRIEWRHESIVWPSEHNMGEVKHNLQGTQDVLTVAGSASTGTDKCEGSVYHIQPGIGLFYFRIRAWNHAGSSSWSGSSYGYWPPMVPNPPLAPIVVTAPGRAFAVSWGIAVTHGTEDCHDIAKRDVAGGICTTRGAGLAASEYQLQWQAMPSNANSQLSWRPLSSLNSSTVARLVHTQDGVKAAVSTAIRAYKIASPSCSLKNNTSAGCHPPGLGDFARSVVWVEGVYMPQHILRFRVRARNAVGWSKPSVPTNGTAFQPPNACATPFYAPSVTQTSIGVAWWPPQSDPWDPVLGYRVFGQSWRPGPSGLPPPSTDGTWVYMLQPRAVHHGPRPQLPPSLSTATWREILPALVGNATQPGVAVAGMPDGAVGRIVDGLAPGVWYRFALAAFSASGLGPVSQASMPLETLASLVKDVRVFAGPPCVFRDGTLPTTFVAMSAGDDVHYTWQRPQGSRIGSCTGPSCGAMRYTFPQAGPGAHSGSHVGYHARHHNTAQFGLEVVARNRAGAVRLPLTLPVRYCGCTDTYDPAFWADADMMVPTLCKRLHRWDGAPATLASKETTPFQLHFSTPQTFAVELTLRVDTGAVDLCWSTGRVPSLFGDPPPLTLLFPRPLKRNACGTFGSKCTKIVHQPSGSRPVVAQVPPPTPLKVPSRNQEFCILDIRNYRVVAVPYTVLALRPSDKLAGRTAPSSLYVALKGKASFSRFELLARPRSFAIEGHRVLVPNVALHIDLPPLVLTFFKLPLGRLGLTDIQISVQAKDKGSRCLAMFSSWDEPYPSSLRAVPPFTPGYQQAIPANGSGCVVTPMPSLWCTNQPTGRDRRATLYLSVRGDITSARVRVLARRHNYAGSDKPHMLGGKVSMHAARSRRVGIKRDMLRFYQLDPAVVRRGSSVGHTQAQLSIHLIAGRLKLLCASVGLPTRGRFAASWQLPPDARNTNGVLVAHGQHRLNITLAPDCGVRMGNSTSNFHAMPLGDDLGQVAPMQYFWSAASMSEADALRERLRSVSHVASFNRAASHSVSGSGTTVFLAALGIDDDNVFEIDVEGQGNSGRDSNNILTVIHS
jgi:hypothetical protein